MHFLIDADLPRDCAPLIHTYGHVASDVRDLGMRQASDPQIAAYAREHRLCLVTADWGFSDIRRFPPGDYSGIVVLGLPDDAVRADILNVLRILMEQPQIIDRLTGRLAIVEKGRIRLRPAL